MWHSIAEAKNKYKGRKGLLVAPGPSADNFRHNGEVLFGVNRSIVVAPGFDFVVVDRPYSLSAIEKYLGNTDYVCMPIWAVGQLSINSKIAIRHQEKILLFGLVYECPEFYTAPEYSLNDFLLHIFWGSVQPALHLAKLTGIRHVDIIGVDGAEVNGRLVCKKVEQLFPADTKKKQTAKPKTLGDYRKARARINAIAKFLGITINFLEKKS